jgi:branched-chain amino acid transport system permease protein
MTAYSLHAYLVQAIHGIVYGVFLFLIASSLTLVFSTMGVLKSSHVGFYMLGAYLAHTVVAWSGNLWLRCVPLPCADVG